jgi:hypothetical protein
MRGVAPELEMLAHPAPRIPVTSPLTTPVDVVTAAKIWMLCQ